MPGGAYPKIVDLALKKLAFDLPELPDTPTEFPRPATTRRRCSSTSPSKRAPRGPELGEIYATLEAATRLRKRVTLTYQTAATGMTSRREVDPYAMVYREGAWLVVGWCHLRKEIRSFRVDRIREAVMAPKPKSPDFERPGRLRRQGVRARARRGRSRASRPKRSSSRSSAEAAEVANEDFGPTAVKRVDGDRTLDHVRLREPRVRGDARARGEGRDPVLRGDQLRARIADELAAIDERYDVTREPRERDARRRAAAAPPAVHRAVRREAPRGRAGRRSSRSMIGADRDELLADLELLSQVGPPDGDPGEYLLVSVEEGRVFVDLAHRLTRPLRLTPAEGCSLLLGIRALRESGIAPFDAAMQSAEKKLLTALGRDASEARDARDDDRRRASPTPPSRRTCARWSPPRASASASRSITSSASRHQAERRPIDPYGIVHHAGEWYVVGHCHKRGDVRTFRIDRIAALRATGERFERPADFDLEAYRRERLYVPSADAVTVRVQLDPLAVTRIGANWPVGEVTMQRRRLRRAPRRLRGLRVGHRLGARPRPPRVDRRPRRGAPRDARAASRGSRRAVGHFGVICEPCLSSIVRSCRSSSRPPDPGRCTTRLEARSSVAASTLG